MIGQITALLILTAMTIYALTRGWQLFRKPGDTKYSRRVTLVVSILYILLGTYMSSCLWRKLMELLQ